jgi:hypothetical protein
MSSYIVQEYGTVYAGPSASNFYFEKAEHTAVAEPEFRAGRKNGFGIISRIRPRPSLTKLYS